MEKNTEDFNKGLSSASSNIKEVAKVLHNLKETVAAFETVNMPEGLGDEFEKMKNTVKELNSKYETAKIAPIPPETIPKKIPKNISFN